MQKNFSAIVLALFLTSTLRLTAQYAQSDTNYKKCFLGSSAFMLINFASNDRPDYVQVNLGYRITGKDVVSLELKT